MKQKKENEMLSQDQRFKAVIEYLKDEIQYCTILVDNNPMLTKEDYMDAGQSEDAAINSVNSNEAEIEFIISNKKKLEKALEIIQEVQDSYLKLG